MYFGTNMIEAKITGIKSKPPGYRFSTKSHANLHVSLVTSGRVYLQSESADFTAQTGMLFYISPGAKLTLTCRETGYTGIHVALGRGQSELPANIAAFRPDIQLRQTGRMIMRELGWDNTTPDADLLPALFRVFTIQALREIDKYHKLHKKHDTEAWVHYLARRIESSIYTNTTIADLISDCPISSRQMRKHFIKIYGIPFKQYQLKCRINEAKRLLEDGGSSITDIAFELGFPSSQHFSTQFREHTGIPPSRYRKA